MHTRACLTELNQKPGQEDRVTAVIPLANASTEAVEYLPISSAPLFVLHYCHTPLTYLVLYCSLYTQVPKDYPLHFAARHTHQARPLSNPSTFVSCAQQIPRTLPSSRTTTSKRKSNGVHWQAARWASRQIQTSRRRMRTVRMMVVMRGMRSL